MAGVTGAEWTSNKCFQGDGGEAFGNRGSQSDLRLESDFFSRD